MRRGGIDILGSARLIRLQRAAHALKGSSRAIGAEALAAACAALEDAGKDGRTAEASVLSDRTAKEFERLRALLQAHLQEIAA